MRISQLAAASGVPVATVKYYLREGLLHEGERTAATQALYDDSHVARLRLVRALLGAGGVSIAQARAILAAIDEPPAAIDLLGTAHNAITPPLDASADVDEVRAITSGWGWHTESCDPAVLGAVAAGLQGLRDGGFDLAPGVLDAYGRAARDIAQAEIDGIPTESAEAAVRYVVLGTVLVEPLLLALRRLAEQVVSGERFGETGPLRG
ncbi:MerR family transcriptional regulator [Schumannella luteola]|uniref:DNA-binding transcriptional MerR regulator n=1 Tax=Schumannella luteola TaxID=472059 RepID=A0A852YGS7_9MICO|nr:MerR family transcriptional regulator [Schumannella luteola]NYG98228.1 DNA-binding transcriptional MerR regulator [Schumannella luteola]TPX02156.1 MerR family transcriptional regulator [Schumannella luteola]